MGREFTTAVADAVDEASAIPDTGEGATLVTPAAVDAAGDGAGTGGGNNEELDGAGDGAGPVGGLVTAGEAEDDKRPPMSCPLLILGDGVRCGVSGDTLRTGVRCSPTPGEDGIGVGALLDPFSDEDDPLLACSGVERALLVSILRLFNGDVSLLLVLLDRIGVDVLRSIGFTAPARPMPVISDDDALLRGVLPRPVEVVLVAAATGAAVATATVAPFASSIPPSCSVGSAT